MAKEPKTQDKSKGEIYNDGYSSGKENSDKSGSEGRGDTTGWDSSGSDKTDRVERDD